MNIQHEDGAHWYINSQGNSVFVPRKEVRKEYAYLNIIKAITIAELQRSMPGLHLRFRPYDPDKYKQDPMYMSAKETMKIEIVYYGYILYTINLSDNHIRLMTRIELKRMVIEKILEKWHKVESVKARQRADQMYELAYSEQNC